MSKHQKEVSTGWRSFNPKSAIRNPKWAVLAMAAVAVVAGGTQAWADPIRYDNPAGPGHFVWYGADSSSPIGLEIISDAASQTGAFHGMGRFGQAFEPANGSSTVSGAWPGGLGDGELEVGGAYGDSLLGVDAGTDIPSGLAWRSTGYIWYPGDPLYLPLGEETYLGVNFQMEDGTHYGWIGVEMFLDETITAYWLDAFAWGYETDAGVPIAAGVPEPGTLALLAIGAVGVLSRRRR